MIIYLKRLKSSTFERVKAFPMYGGIGVSAPSLRSNVKLRESTAYVYRVPILDTLERSCSNCLFASKDHVRPVSKRLWIFFMACSCPKFVLGRLKKKKKMEKIAVFPFSVYNSSNVF